MSRSPKFNRKTFNIYRHQKLRAKLYNQVVSYSLAELRDIAGGALELPCFYCGGRLAEDNLSADHATPISRYGSFNLDNVLICCQSCNRAKGDLTAAEYIDLMKLIENWPFNIQMNFLSRLKMGGRNMNRRGKR